MIKDYKIEKKLGEGSFGVVFKVKKKIDNYYKYFVLKQISLIGQSDENIKKIKGEAEILSTIKSKYVVKYYESFEKDNNLNIIMEYCEKGDLEEFIKKKKKEGKPLPENEVLELFIKITIGLGEIHKMNILHRDLKSLNVFLKNYNIIRVGDLGVSKVLDNSLYAKTRIGTPYYISPEICEDRPYNVKSDIWALGCILYELCTFRRPFESKNLTSLILKILNENPKPISNYSLNLKLLIDKIFNKNYRKRPTCIDILKDKYILGAAEELHIINDIKKSFPEIFNPNIGPNHFNSGNIRTNSDQNNNRFNNFQKNERIKDKSRNKSNNKIAKKNSNNINKDDKNIKKIEKKAEAENSKSDKNKINKNKEIANTIFQDLDNVQNVKNNENEDIIKKNRKLENDLRGLDIKGSLPLFSSVEFNELIDDFNNSGDEKDKNDVEEEKKDLKDDLKYLGEKIEILKNEIKKSFGDEKYVQITKIYDTGINDETKNEEVNTKIEKFIQQNPLKDSKDKKEYNIFSLYILESQYVKKEKKFNNL